MGREGPYYSMAPTILMGAITLPGVHLELDIRPYSRVWGWVGG